MKHVQVHTDGGCHGNPGPGAWAAVLQYKTWRKEVQGADLATTNNRMEIQAAIGALTALKERCEVTIHTDSEYLRNGITSWVHGWKKNGWRTKDKKAVKNRDLWQALDAAAQQHKVNWQWLKGHAGHPENERCDQIAQAAMADLKKRHSRAELTEALARFKEEPEDAPETGGAKTNSFQF